MKHDPITGGFNTAPPRYPLGIPIAEKVSVGSIPRHIADAVYEHYHSYIPRGRQGWHYGVYVHNDLAGAISFDAWPSQSTIRGHPSAEIREVSRVCISRPSPNLASCAMAKAQDTFLENRGDGIELLVTYIREDYEGSMFAALQSKGWERDGHSTGHAPGNRKEHDIHNWDKERWVCEV